MRDNMNEKRPFVVSCLHEKSAKTDGLERRGEQTSFLLVLTETSVVTVSSAGRARISLKHGLDAPNPDDLIS